MSFQILNVLCVLMFVYRTNAFITPPAPIPMPVEASNFSIQTPLPPIIMDLCEKVDCLARCVPYKDENGCKRCKCPLFCDKFMCPDVDSICIRKEGKRAYCGNKKDEKAACKVMTGCRLDCRYGFEQNLNGCDMCSCLQPCKDMKCGAGMECNSEIVDGKVTGVCSPISKCMKNYCDLECEDGFASDNNNCPVCACSDPCKDMKCSHGCEKVQNAVFKKTEWKCKVSTEACDKEECSKWCGKKRINFLGLFSKQKCSMCNCNDRCMDVTCGENEVCTKETKSDCSGDICITYEHLHCKTECVMMKCKFQCVHGYKKDRKGCPTCNCKPHPIFLSTFKPPYPSPTPYQKLTPLFTKQPTNSSMKCKGTCDQGYFCSVIPSENVCLPCSLKCDKSCLYGVEGGECASCVCKPNPCDQKKCGYDKVCFPTFRNDKEVSDHVCLYLYKFFDPYYKICSEVINLINKNDSVYNNYNNHYKNFTRNNYNCNFNQVLDCSEKGNFKKVQLVNDVVVCITTVMGRIKVKENCRPNNMLKMTVRVDNDNQLKTIRKRISEKLQEISYFSEDYVVVSKMHQRDGYVQGNALLIVKNYDNNYNDDSTRLNYHIKFIQTALQDSWLQISGLEKLLMPSTLLPETTTKSYFYNTDRPNNYDAIYFTVFLPTFIIFVNVLVWSIICFCRMRMIKAQTGNSCHTIPAPPPAYLTSDFPFSKLEAEKDVNSLKGVTNC